MVLRKGLAGLGLGALAAAVVGYGGLGLALAEALNKSGDSSGAHDSYQRARDLTRALPPSADRDGWQRDADLALQRK